MYLNHNFYSYSINQNEIVLLLQQIHNKNHRVCLRRQIFFLFENHYSILSVVAAMYHYILFDSSRLFQLKNNNQAKSNLNYNLHEPCWGKLIPLGLYRNHRCNLLHCSNPPSHYLLNGAIYNSFLNFDHSYPRFTRLHGCHLHLLLHQFRYKDLNRLIDPVLGSSLRRRLKSF